MKSICIFPKLQFTLNNYSIHFIRLSAGPIIDGIPLHKHGNDNFEIHFISSGFGWVQLENTRIPVGPGDLFITGPGILHSQFSDLSNPMEEYCINLIISSEDDHSCKILSRLSKFHESDLMTLLNLYRKIANELEKKSEFYEEECISNLKTILIILFRKVLDDISSNKIQEKGTIQAERSLIIDQYFISCPPDASLQNLANQLFLSTRQTQRILQQYFGVSFQKKLTEARLAKGKLMLKESNLSVGTIGSMLGFSSLEHFSQTFKKNIGYTPSTYRKIS